MAKGERRAGEYRLSVAHSGGGDGVEKDGTRSW